MACPKFDRPARRLIHPTDLRGSAPPSCLSAPIPRKYRALAHTAMPVRKNTMVMGGIGPSLGVGCTPPRIVNESSRKGNDHLYRRRWDGPDRPRSLQAVGVDPGDD